VLFRSGLRAAAADRAGGPAPPTAEVPAGSRGGASPSSNTAGPLLDLGIAGDVALLPTTAAVHAPPVRPAVVRPLAPARYQITVTVPAETHAKLLRVRDLLRHAIPSGDAALILDRALTVLLAQLEKAKFAALTPRAGTATAAGGRANDIDTVPSKSRAPAAKRSRSKRPGGTLVDERRAVRREDAGGASGALATGERSGSKRPEGAVPGSTGPPGPTAPRSPRSRYIAAAVRREVWARSRGQCEFVSESGHRCDARAWLEFHHRVPFAAGGVNSATNVAVHCRSHNGHEADAFFGTALVNARRAAGSRLAAGGQSPTKTALSPSLATVNSCRDSASGEDAKGPDTG